MRSSRPCIIIHGLIVHTMHCRERQGMIVAGVIWDEEDDPNGNVAQIAEHDISNSPRRNRLGQ